MSIERSKAKDYRSLSPQSRKRARLAGDQPSLRPSGVSSGNVATEPQDLVNLGYGQPETASERPADVVEFEPRIYKIPDPQTVAASSFDVDAAAPLPDGPREAPDKQARKQEKDQRLLSKDRWLIRSGHTLTFVGLYLFSIMVLFRPYEIVPGLGFLSATAFYFAVATLAIYIPSQLATEGNLSILTTEVKAIIAMAVIALFTIPIAKDPNRAWLIFNDPFIKAVAIFIVMINVVRTRERLMKMLWLSIGIGIYLAVSALNLYMQGKFKIEEYRIAVDVGGMFGNPNEMAMHFVMMTPIVITLGIAAKSKVSRVFYFIMAALFVAANMVTFSRGGFLGVIACCGVLAWKLGRKHRLNVTVASIVVGGIAIIAAPGNYGLRMMSIFIPGLDAVGSNDQRRELLIRSLQVTARNPWGIGIGNFPIVGIRNLQSHNAFTQVSSELGILGLIAYLVFMISPFRKLGAIERNLFDADDHSWYYYLAIGLQASIVGYMVSSFFASVAYNWFIYYLIAYAVAFRRIYSIEAERKEKMAPNLEPLAV